MKKRLIILFFISISILSCEKNQVSKREDLNLSFLDKNEILIATVYNKENKAVNQELLNNLGKVENFDQVQNLFKQYGISNSVSSKIVIKMKEDYENLNKFRLANNNKFTQLTNQGKIDFINEILDSKPKSTENMILNSVGCSDTFHTGLHRCDRNYGFDKLINFFTLGFQHSMVPISGYVAGEIKAFQDLLNCQDEVYDKYLTCLTS